MQAVVINVEPMSFELKAVEPVVTARKIVHFYFAAAYKPALITTVIAVGGSSLSAVPNPLRIGRELAGV